ncbi:YeiH family protein [Parabacteroides sp. Marseille-P3160]|uniref:YeiH family protein n=1 Tax=Parabacteroides sp. Marseille-P3160 TaxID=1917887 RepID=UPI0009BC4330|nr:putative sulfate exporter family transporter [Parabacteroides sp. Marseille-P3160]
MKKLHLTEDWAATLTGLLFVLISLGAFALSQYTPEFATFGWKNGEELIALFSAENLYNLLLVFIISYVLLVLAYFFQGKPIKETFGYVGVFLLTAAASLLGGNKMANDWGLETVIFSLAIGLLINNLWGTPQWIRKALSSELYIKIGLIFLGSTILFQNLLKSGALGLIQSVVVVFSIWYFSFWLCKRFKIDKELSIMLSSAVSICGVSAAIASAGAIKGDSKKLSYVVSLVLIVAVPMIIIMPILAKLIGLNETIAGAWIGGTIDTTGAVVATGALYGEEALRISTIVKFSQNVLLGIAAFFIALYWNYSKKEKTDASGERPGLQLMWERFPKFVLGFILVSLLFSFFFAGEGYKPVTDSLKKFQNLWFTLGFVSIGLETNFKALINAENKKAGFVFLGAQLFNILFTLLVAYVVFGIRWETIFK